MQPNIFEKISDASVRTYIIILVLVCALFYLRTVFFGLVYFDDVDLIVQRFGTLNKSLSEIAGLLFNPAFNKDVLGAEYFRPLLTLSFALDGLIGGVNPAIYHITNIAFHAATVVLVFAALVKMNYDKFASFILAFFFAVHPLANPIAIWISGRNDSLMALAVILSFFFLIKYLESDRLKKKIIFFFFHLTLLCVGLLVKEAVAVVPVVLFLYIFLYRKDKLISKRTVPLYSGWLLSVGGFAILHILSTPYASYGSLDTIGIAVLPQSYPTLLALLGKIFFPIKMSGCPQFEPLSIISGIAVLAAAISLIAFNKNVNKRRVIFGLLWYFVFISPTLFIKLFEQHYDYLESRAYLPFVGLVIMIMEILRAFNIDFTKKRALISAFAILLIFCIRSEFYQTTYKNGYEFWGNVINLYPENYAGYFDLGHIYYRTGNTNKAEEMYLKSSALKPSHAGSFLNLSEIYLDKGEYAKAADAAARATAIDPRNSKAFNNLGTAYALLENWQKALPAFEKAREFGGVAFKGYFNLGLAYFNTQDYNRAVETFNRVIALNRRDDEAFLYLGMSYLNLGDGRAGENFLLKAISINPGNFKAFQILTQYYINSQRKNDARAMLLEMVKRGWKPDSSLLQQPESRNVMPQKK